MTRINSCCTPRRPSGRSRSSGLDVDQGVNMTSQLCFGPTSINRHVGWEKVVSYSTLMVNLELGKTNAGLLAIAGDLAERFHAHVIGIAACQPMQFVYGMGYVSADYFERDLADLRKDSQAAESEFRSALQSRGGSVEWRSTVEFGALSGHIAHEARSADLVITSVDSGGLFRCVAICQYRLISSCRLDGPCWSFPQALKALALDRVLVAWKDTRETRRAILDALPLLKKAAHVTLAEIAVEDRLAAGPQASRGSGRLAWTAWR